MEPRLMSFSDLVGRRVLVVEDDYDQAQELASAIEKHGGDVVGPYPDIEAAFLALQKAEVDAAVLDIRLAAEDVFPLADLLRDVAGAPFDRRRHCLGLVVVISDMSTRH